MKDEKKHINLWVNATTLYQRYPQNRKEGDGFPPPFSLPYFTTYAKYFASLSLPASLSSKNAFAISA